LFLRLEKWPRAGSCRLLQGPAFHTLSACGRTTTYQRAISMKIKNGSMGHKLFMMESANGRVFFVKFLNKVKAREWANDPNNNVAVLLGDCANFTVEEIMYLSNRRNRELSA
jgi:hypothetical protein